MHTFDFPTAIEIGPGARFGLSDHVKRLSRKRPLLLTDAGLKEAPFIRELHDHLNASGLSAEVYANFSGNPLESHVIDGAAAYRTHQADCLIAVGGGAAIDVCKAVGVLVSHNGSLFDYVEGGPKPIENPIPDFIAIPTTAGTGSEVGRSTVISEETSKIKRILFSPRLLPIQVIADPELTLGLPAKITAATGLDALTHLLEAYLAKGYHPICDGIAIEGIAIIHQHLETCVAQPNNIEARTQMLVAAMMGAIAFQKGLGVNHSCAHALSTVCDLHHGIANGIMLPITMRWNAEKTEPQFQILAQRLGMETTAEVVDWLETLNTNIGIPKKLSDLGVSDRHLEDLISIALKDGCHELNPRKVARQDFMNLFNRALGFLNMLRIGLGPCFFHADPLRPIFKGKTLLYAEKSITQSLMQQGALPFLIPPPCDPLSISDFIDELDGVVLQGGSDVSPTTYGTEPLQDAWAGDPIRDELEIEIIEHCLSEKVPILGICRGLQLINVALGGTLFQDLSEQYPKAITHRDWEHYDKLSHEIEIRENSKLYTIYNGLAKARVNTIHHQAIDKLAKGLSIQATCHPRRDR